MAQKQRTCGTNNDNQNAREKHSNDENVEEMEQKRKFSAVSKAPSNDDNATNDRYKESDGKDGGVNY